MYEWRTGRSCLFKNNVHLVFVTKYRRGVFRKEMLERTEAIMKETCEQMDCELLEFGGEHDHIHMMVSVHPKVAISNLVSKLKGKSSYMIRREYWDRVKQCFGGIISGRQATALCLAVGLLLMLFGITSIARTNHPVKKP